jgi:post-segregation antitoxin (ccd killing protein)
VYAIFILEIGSGGERAMVKGRNSTSTGVRLPDELLEQARARAAELDVTVSMLVRKALEMYLAIAGHSERSGS